MSITCPDDCKQDRDEAKTDITGLWKISISPIAQRIVVYLIGVLFASVAFTFMYSVTTYATKEDLKETKVDLKHEIEQGFKMLELKLAKGK